MDVPEIVCRRAAAHGECRTALAARPRVGAERLAGDALELGRRRCALLSRLTGVEPDAIWEWGFVERVSTGLLLLQVGLEPLGREFLAVAEAWASQ